LEIDDKIIEEARRATIMQAKAMTNLINMVKFMEEFTGVVHQLVLDLYRQTGKEIPNSFIDYKFKNVNPWTECDN